ncbi:sperm motility kinase 2B-like [Castor canadensis]|jgi:MAP/microtubule affinity-regulating kinase|uniref:Sperm motility kinase 2B-like n=5 Tax=Castor canadensis TaxID=51338 RepID=A0AC58MX12_CASCN
MERKVKNSFFGENIVTKHYTILHTLGQGGFGEVKLAQHRVTGAQVAIKIVSKGEQSFTSISSEVAIMKSIEHPNIVRLFHVIESKKSVYMVMEFASGGDLHDYVLEKGQVEEGEARKLFYQITCALSYCHSKGIVHHDLKPENILVDGSGSVKLSDFGLSAIVQAGEKLLMFCGTDVFWAPELFDGKAYEGPPVDVWSLGMTLYYILTGSLPFSEDTTCELEQQIRHLTFQFPACLSAEVQQLTHYILTADPRGRPTVADIIQHPWLKADQEQRQEIPPTQSYRNVLGTMRGLGYHSQEIRDSLMKKSYNHIMATFLLLQHQTPQGDSSSRQEEEVKDCDDPPCLPLTDPVNSFQRRLSATALHSVIKSVAPEHQKGGDRQKGRRPASWPAVATCRGPTKARNIRASHCGIQDARHDTSDGQKGERGSVSSGLPPRPPTLGAESPITSGQPQSGTIRPTQGDDDHGGTTTFRKKWRRAARGLAKFVRGLCCCCVLVSKRKSQLHAFGETGQGSSKCGG